MAERGLICVLLDFLLYVIYLDFRILVHLGKQMTIRECITEFLGFMFILVYSPKMKSDTSTEQRIYILTHN